LFLEELEPRVVLSLAGNQLFPSDNPWNQRITNAPVAANSATLVASIGANSPLHPDFGTVMGSTWNGIPYNVVSGNSLAKINVEVTSYASESDIVPIPIPSNVVIEGDLSTGPSSNNNGDRHMIIYDQDTNIVYETFGTQRPSETSDGRWHAASESVWNLNQDSFRPAGWTSADAAGLPILPGLVRTDEVLQQGVINHAIRVTVPASQQSYVYPASHEAGSSTSSSLPPMGERFRLKASVDISGFSKTDQVILQALKDYGMIVADNGGPWFISGAPSMSWSDDDLHNLTQIIGSDFEAVNLTPIVNSLSVSTGAAGSTVTINGLCFSGGAGMTKVYFGSVAATNIQIVSDTQIIATVPSQAVGTKVDVTVASPYGTSVKKTADQFTYGGSNVPPPPPSSVVSAISPAEGSITGGAVVTISGSGFTGASGVSFGSQPASSFTVNSDSSITAVAPAEAAGIVNITVTTSAGASAVNSADQFSFLSSPLVTAVSPAMGSTAGGKAVTITGANFSGASSVTFGPNAASSFSVNSNGSITATAPAGSAGTVNIWVTTQAGESATVSADQFTYMGAPVVTGISPSSGSTAGGTQVTISGSNFTGITSVTFGTKAATSFSVNNDGSITAVAPAQAAGAVDILVSGPGGASTAVAVDQFTYLSLAVQGSLTASVNTGKTSANLTKLGIVDWNHWGKGGMPGFDHKSTGGSQISTFTKVGSGGTVYNYGNDPRPLSWTDGTVLSSYSNTYSGVYVAGIGRGFTFTAPASTVQHTLNVFVGGWYSSGKLVAHLSDGSAADYVMTTGYTAGQYDRQDTLVYTAGSANQTLTVTWTMASGTGNVTLNAAALSSAVAPPAAPTGLTATVSNGVISLNWTAATGATTYNIYRATASGGEGTTPIASGVAGTTFSDWSATPGSTYYYKITAVTSDGAGGFLQSTFSVQVSVAI
jgi:hypothetical protein